MLTSKSFILTLLSILIMQNAFAAEEQDYQVSNVEEFRAALAASGKRVIHFKVPESAKNNPNGFILYAKDHVSYVINNGDVTIDGSTASVPVTLYGASLQISAKNVKLTNLRVRLGATGFTRRGKNKKEAKNVAREALLIDKAENVEITHSSFSWGTDETISIVSSKNIKLKNVLISEPLNEPKDERGQYVHYEELPHGYCFLIRGSEKVLVQNVVFAHCLCRSPSISPDGKYQNSVLVANSIVYNYGEQGSKYNDGTTPEHSDYYTLNKNLYLPGSDSAGNAIEIDYPNKGSVVNLATIDNYQDNREAEVTYVKKKNKGKIRHDNRFRLAFEEIELIPATELEEPLLNNVGARLPTPDLVDARVLNEIRKRKGKIINHENETPEYPHFKKAMR